MSRRLAIMDNRCWYEADALFEDLTLCRHVILGASEEKVEKRMRGRYPDAVAILVSKATRVDARRGSPYESV
jgi:hypothetical protein